jgi:hypothetical protein
LEWVWRTASCGMELLTWRKRKINWQMEKDKNFEFRVKWNFVHMNWKAVTHSLLFKNKK